MKVSFLSIYSGLVYRGVETFVHELSNNLVDLGIDVSVFQSGPKLSGAKYQTTTIKTSLDLDKKNNYLPYFGYYSRQSFGFSSQALAKVDKETDIIIPTNGQWQSLLSKKWAIINHKKMIISGHSGPGLDDRLNLFTFPDVFVTFTDTQLHWANQANPFVKTQKIPNGVDLQKFNPSIAPLAINLPRPIILCVAALDFWKRNDLVIKAVAKLPTGSLLLVGKGEQQQQLQELGDKLLPGRFKIMAVEPKQMPSVYRCADLFTFATVPWESFGIVLIEAMASGLPIVTADDPIRREIVGDAGLFVNVQNSLDYAASLKQALTNNWDKLSLKQAEKYSWTKVSKQYVDLFKILTKQ